MLGIFKKEAEKVWREIDHYHYFMEYYFASAREREQVGDLEGRDRLNEEAYKQYAFLKKACKKYKMLTGKTVRVA